MMEPIIKYYSENEFIIKIKNHKDEEITIEKLVEQYYNNSSNYFTLKEC